MGYIVLMIPRVVKTVKEGAAYFEIRWSELRKAEKYDIQKTVPSMAGIFELYTKDRYGKFVLMVFGYAWHGGLRAVLRRQTDPDITDFERSRDIFRNKRCWYRYSLLEDFEDMRDIKFFFSRTYFPRRVPVPHSERYSDIFVKESAPQKIVTV